MLLSSCGNYEDAEEDVADEDFDGNDDGWKSLHSYEFQVVE